MTIPKCPECQSRAIAARLPDSPEVLLLHCRRCEHEWERQMDHRAPEILLRLSPLPHWK